jgi:hypothetical protein
MADEQWEQHYRLEASERVVFVRGGAQTGWQVWLDQYQDFDGVHLASAGTRAAALTIAAAVLLEAVRLLRQEVKSELEVVVDEHRKPS